MPAIAGAQTRDCLSIAHPTERLNCYDNIAPSPAQRAPTASRPAAPVVAARPASAERREPLGDMLDEENSRLDAKIKGICRGC
jgi:hypothetical protein